MRSAGPNRNLSQSSTLARRASVTGITLNQLKTKFHLRDLSAVLAQPGSRSSGICVLGYRSAGKLSTPYSLMLSELLSWSGARRSRAALLWTHALAH